MIKKPQVIPPMLNMSAMDRQEGWETTMQIMQIIPDNQTAKKLFTKCYEYTNSTGDDYHAKFMVKLPIAESVLDAEAVESDTDYESASAMDFEEQPYEGYYNISIAEESQRKMVRVGWNIGKGLTISGDKHRRVDILLAKPGDLLSKTLPGIICKLYLHDQLGILVVERPEKSKGDVKIKVDDSWESFTPGEERPLFRKSSWLRAGHCDYEFRYAVQPSEREQFLAQRDKIPKANNIAKEPSQSETKIQAMLPRLPPLRYIPGDPIWSNGRYVRLGTIARGAFGYVREGFRINSCQRIAIKELRLGKNHDCDLLTNELDVMDKLQVSSPSTLSDIS